MDAKGIEDLVVVELEEVEEESADVVSEEKTEMEREGEVETEIEAEGEAETEIEAEGEAETEVEAEGEAGILVEAEEEKAEEEETLSTEVLHRPTKNWAERLSTSKFISLMGERYSRLCKMPFRERKKFWRDLGDELNVSGNDVRTRWNRLLFSHTRTNASIADYKSRYGREPERRWFYYDQMDRIIGSHTRKARRLVSSPPGPASSGAPLSAGTLLQPAAGQPVGVFKLGPDGLLQQVSDSLLQGVSPATVSNVQATVLQAGTPQQQQADIEAFAHKRKALFVEDYLRAKARREDHRLQLEERRIKVLERLMDVLEARNNL